jgi:hypothetical protein
MSSTSPSESDDAAPERPSDNRARQQRNARIRRQRVHAGRDRLAHRHREVRLRAELDDRGSQLLEEERVSSGSFDDSREVDRAVKPRQEPGGERRRVLGRQWVERDRRLRRQPCAPGRMLVEQLGACRGDEHRRRVAQVVNEVLEQRDLARLCPMDVLEDEHGRLLQTDAFEEAPRGEEKEQLLGGVVWRKAE